MHFDLIENDWDSAHGSPVCVCRPVVGLAAHHADHSADYDQSDASASPSMSEYTGKSNEAIRTPSSSSRGSQNRNGCNQADDHRNDNSWRKSGCECAGSHLHAS